MSRDEWVISHTDMKWPRRDRKRPTTPGTFAILSQDTFSIVPWTFPSSLGHCLLVLEHFLSILCHRTSTYSETSLYIFSSSLVGIEVSGNKWKISLDILKICAIIPRHLQLSPQDIFLLSQGHFLAWRHFLLALGHFLSILGYFILSQDIYHPQDIS